MNGVSDRFCLGDVIITDAKDPLSHFITNIAGNYYLNGRIADKIFDIYIYIYVCNVFVELSELKTKNGTKKKETRTTKTTTNGISKKNEEFNKNI